jgi:hypothetical protein
MRRTTDSVDGNDLKSTVDLGVLQAYVFGKDEGYGSRSIHQRHFAPVDRTSLTLLHVRDFYEARRRSSGLIQ